MATISKAVHSKLEDPICQGDIFKNVKYNYIDTEDDQSVSELNLNFPMPLLLAKRVM